MSLPHPLSPDAISIFADFDQVKLGRFLIHYSQSSNYFFNKSNSMTTGVFVWTLCCKLAGM